LPQKIDFARPFQSRTPMTDLAAARRNMVDGQIRTSDVTDLRLIGAMLDLPREQFVPPELAYLDLDVPVGDGRAGRRTLKPMVLAKLIQAADIGPADRVLDVACATGYSSALLAQLAGEVVALEDDPTMARSARQRLSTNAKVKVVTGPLSAGWAAGAPYDAILVNGMIEVVPKPLCDQLKEAGRLVCVLGSGPAAKATLFLRSGSEVGRRGLFDAAAAPLPGFVKPPAFIF
jgi:protein-L-isoaspartate(D-aspartate) O-methyltransferase